MFYVTQNCVLSRRWTPVDRNFVFYKHKHKQYKLSLHVCNISVLKTLVVGRRLISRMYLVHTFFFYFSEQATETKSPTHHEVTSAWTNPPLQLMMRLKQEHLLSFLLRVALLVLLPFATAAAAAATTTKTVHEFAHDATCRKSNSPRILQEEQDEM